MKALVVGVGKIGSEVARALARHAEVDTLGLVDISKPMLEQVQAKTGSKRLRLHCLTDATLVDALPEVMREYDVAVITLPSRKASYQAVEAAIQARLNVVDILEEYHRRPDPAETEGLHIPQGISLGEYGESLHERARAHDVLILDGMGFAPGLSNLTVGEGIRKLDRAERAVARVGGIPVKEAALRHPLGYVITWSFAHVLREYAVDVSIMQEGRVTTVPAMSERELFRFSELGQDEELECAITPGMPSIIFSRPDLREFSEKTIRWPGHWDGIQTLKECGLLELAPVKLLDGMIEIVPRLFLSSILRPKLEPAEGDTDVCIMWNTVSGVKDNQPTKVDYYLWEEADRENHISAMARVTALPASIAALLVGRGEIDQRGIVPPEDAMEGQLYAHFMDELGAHGVRIKEVVSAG